ncbi:hypothetical protein HPP92_023358 [Vanilla planifolia]|uniref:Uncharacterized protein n=1 Tax=Vanilla planifolia TaxID=51239 RepID=A0A835PX53_VANPL|nr:hypothetical protein HPP92_023643 [Vanilla planifolia]KAG0460230.1 hypothetical protein HPP92_023358 [Vanilla planifolia]
MWFSRLLVLTSKGKSKNKSGSLPPAAFDDDVVAVGGDSSLLPELEPSLNLSIEDEAVAGDSCKNKFRSIPHSAYLNSVDRAGGISVVEATGGDSLAPELESSVTLSIPANAVAGDCPFVEVVGSTTAFSAEDDAVGGELATLVEAETGTGRGFEVRSGVLSKLEKERGQFLDGGGVEGTAGCRKERLGGIVGNWEWSNMPISPLIQPLTAADGELWDAVGFSWPSFAANVSRVLKSLSPIFEESGNNMGKSQKQRAEATRKMKVSTIGY